MADNALPKTFAVAAPIADRVALACPHCGNNLASVHNDRFVVHGREAWLDDSDAIPGATAAAAGFPADQGTLAFLSIGACTCCNGSYAVVEVAMLDGDFALLCDYQAGAPPFDMESVQPVFMDAGSAQTHTRWILIATDTVAGPVHEHLHGPFALDGHQLTTVMSSSGVTACGAINVDGSPWAWAKEYVLRHWPQMRALHPVLGSASVG